MKYLDRLLNLLNKKDNEKKKSQFQEAQSKLSLESALLSTKQKLEEKQQLLEVSKSEYPLDFKKMASISSEIEDLKRGSDFLEDLKKELF